MPNPNIERRNQYNMSQEGAENLQKFLDLVCRKIINANKERNDENYARLQKEGKRIEQDGLLFLLELFFKYLGDALGPLAKAATSSVFGKYFGNGNPFSNDEDDTSSVDSDLESVASSKSTPVPASEGSFADNLSGLIDGFAKTATDDEKTKGFDCFVDFLQECAQKFGLMSNPIAESMILNQFQQMKKDKSSSSIDLVAEAAKSAFKPTR